ACRVVLEFPLPAFVAVRHVGGVHFGDQPVARLAGDHVHLPGLHVGARGGAAREREDALHRLSRHRVGAKRPQRAPREQRLLHVARAAAGREGQRPLRGVVHRSAGYVATPPAGRLRSRSTFQRRFTVAISSRRAEPFTICFSSKSGWKPSLEEKEARLFSTAPMIGLDERTWFTMKISPPGLQTRCSSCSTRAGLSTTETTYMATTRSKLASGNAIDSAFISISASTLERPRRATRARAFSSISRETSMPVTRTPGGYIGSESPVPTPTSSTRSPGWQASEIGRASCRERVWVSVGGGGCIREGRGPIGSEEGG